MTKRRITVPEGHIALLLPHQLADELGTMLRNKRKKTAKSFRNVELANKGQIKSSFEETVAWAEYKVAGDLLLALMEVEQ